MDKKSKLKSLPVSKLQLIEKFPSILWDLQTPSLPASQGEVLGDLRGGSGGCVAEARGSRHITGGCPRLAHLRRHGIQDPIDTRTDIMFQNGFGNEEQVLATLERGEYSSLCEEEIPVTGYTKNGTKITGRPDIVIMDKDTPVMGLELKQIASIWSAREILLLRQPKIANVIQAAHYSMRLDIPFYLVYTSRVNWEIPEKDYFQKDAKGHPAVEERDGYPCKIRPFHMCYKLEWRGDELWITIDQDETATQTVITKSGIEAFYNGTAEMESDKDLGPRPRGMTVWGKLSAKKGPCYYCDHKAFCDSEPSYDEFMSHFKGESK